jgi:O-antigen ligase
MNLDFSSTEIAIALASGVVLSCWLALIAAPAWRCYGRMWEKLAASFLTLFILGTLLGMGAAVGLALVWSYDQYA